MNTERSLHVTDAAFEKRKQFNPRAPDPTKNFPHVTLDRRREFNTERDLYCHQGDVRLEEGAQ